MGGRNGYQWASASGASARKRRQQPKEATKSAIEQNNLFILSHLVGWLPCVDTLSASYLASTQSRKKCLFSLFFFPLFFPSSFIFRGARCLYTQISHINKSEWTILYYLLLSLSDRLTSATAKTATNWKQNNDCIDYNRQMYLPSIYVQTIDEGSEEEKKKLSFYFFSLRCCRFSTPLFCCASSVSIPANQREIY